jgi:hypothetical protein
MIARQLSGVPFDGSRQLDVTCRSPELLPSLLRQIKIGLVEVMVAARRAKRGSHLGVGDPARQRSITSVPYVGGQLASILFDQQFYEGAGVEIDENHSSATLLAYQFSHGPAGPGTRTTRRYGADREVWPRDDPFSRQPFEHGGSADSEEASNGDATVGDHDFVPFMGALEPFTQVRSQVTDSHVHDRECTLCRQS